jgi:Tfp pilus assembly protein PilZ
MRHRYNRREAEFVFVVEQLEELERLDRVDPFYISANQEKRARLERRLVELISADRDERRDRVRLLCNLPVIIDFQGRASPGVVTDIGTGGVFVKTNLRGTRGDKITIEIVNNSKLGDGLRLYGWVAWCSDASAEVEKRGLGIAFHANDENNLSYVRAFILELLREQLEFA